MRRSRPSTAAVALIAILGSAGIAHFAKPDFFDPLVPSWMPGSARLTTYLSGVVELSAAILVAIPRTRRFGGWFALATFAAVYPANIQAALDGGMKDMDPPFDSAAAAWLRLPFQLPLFWLAWRVAREGRPSA
ncbi:MAG: hypothetical protein NTZ21_08115 [Actinobacteria bacterium]|nr:hypothetical protein [Actinomycetota bacterium]